MDTDGCVDEFLVNRRMAGQIGGFREIFLDFFPGVFGPCRVSVLDTSRMTIENIDVFACGVNPVLGNPLSTGHFTELKDR